MIKSSAMMTRGGGKSEDSSKKQVGEFQILNQRMEEMAAKFKTDLNDFRNVLQEKSMARTSASEDNVLNGDLLKLSEKFSLFEKTVMTSLDSLRQDMNQIKIEVATNNNNILVHGVNEDSPDIYQAICDLMHSKININVQKNDINYCYRLGTTNTRDKKPRPILVSFCCRWLRDQIFYSKKLLKGSNVLFTELLTAENLKLFKVARGHFRNHCWTRSGKVIVLCEGVQVVVFSQEKLSELIGKA